MGTLRFFEEVVSFKIRRTFGFADYNYLCSYEATGIFTFVRDLDVVRFGAERAIDRGVG